MYAIRSYYESIGQIAVGDEYFPRTGAGDGTQRPQPQSGSDQLPESRMPGPRNHPGPQGQVRSDLESETDYRYGPTAAVP